MLRVVFMVIALIVGLVVGLPAAGETRGGGRAAAVGGVAPPDDESSAMQRARELGQPVEIMSRRTSTTQVFAEPDGNQRMVASALPMFALKGSSWVDIDPALEPQAGGTVAPAAADLDMAFSGGGSGPLVRATKDGVSVAYTWPVPLPAPTLSGATATYADVLPGVDLKLTAGPDGFSQVLVLRQPVPDLAEVRLGTQVTGGTLQIDKVGNITVLDESGDVAMHGNAPQMWDSSGSATEIGDRLIGPRTGDATAAVGARMEGSALVLSLDQDFLGAPGLTFPVYIDPPMHAAGRSAFAFVSKHFAGTKYYGSGDVARVGYYDDPNVPTGPTRDTYRSFFRMNTAPVNGKHIIRATLRTFEVHSWSCSARPVELWRTGSIGTGTTWNNQPSWVARVATVNVAKGYSSSCNDGGVDFDATSAVVEAAGRKWSNLTLGLRATNEADTFGWKKFRNNPVLEITYNTTPNVPDQRSAVVGVSAGVPCATGAAAPYITTLTPTLRARVSDPDGANGQTVRAHFEWHRTGGAKIGERITTYVASGTPVTAPVPAGAIIDGARVSWRVRAQDGTATSGTSAWSPWCEVIADLSRPAGVPAVSSTDFPETPEGGDPVPGGGVGVMGSFTIRRAASDTDVNTFLYALNSDDPGTATAVIAAADGSAVIRATPSRSLLNTLYVWSRDKAGHIGPYKRYEFSVRPAAGPAAHWKLDESAGEIANDSSGNGHHATRVAGPTAADGPTWIKARDKGAVRMSKGGRFQSQQTGLIRTDRNFSVAAWVRLTDKANNRIALSVDGNHRDGFHLMYNATFDRWAMVMASADTAEAVTYHMARSDAPPAMNNWTQLVGTYDAVSRQISLYVDGRLQAITSTQSSPWNATGVINIGRGKNPDVPWWGEVDDVRVYNRLIYPSEIVQLTNRPVIAEGHWRFDEASGNAAADSSGRNRHGTWQGAPQWTDGWLGGAARFGGRYGTADPPGHVTTSPVLRVDRSFSVAAWVRLPTDSGTWIVLTQDDGLLGPFSLTYDRDKNRWGAIMRTAGGTSVEVDAPDPPAFDTWTHLAVTYDYPTGEIRLYVDGVLETTATHLPPWYVGGKFVIGKARNIPLQHQYLTIDDVRAYSGVLTEDEIADLAYE
ncbi:LamG-like jellyroll fold domain-containing protein [Nonomuraea sp. NPDC049486]|uniref:LamG-like jellyroll fold domain-containing protein n=1 Tax=Nonomuraea sp. NPDC049486 TaxID=3155773 RepID=UPI003414DA66